MEANVFLSVVFPFWPGFAKAAAEVAMSYYCCIIALDVQLVTKVKKENR